MPELTTYPRGWFVAAFSDEIPAQGVKAMRFFGEKLVAFRGEGGAVHVLDGYCAHMGADLGAGGVVVGDSIRCPFHAWRYCGTGECVEIPYAKKIPPKAKQRAWTVRETNGVVLVWHDERGGSPDFEVPAIADFGSPDWTAWNTSHYPIKTHPREIVENLADRAHFPSVHHTEIDEFDFSVDGHTATQRVKGRALLPGGGVDRFGSTTTYHGPGLLLMRMGGVMQNYMIVAHTPVDSMTLELRMGVMLKNVAGAEMDKLVGLYMTNLKAGFEDDIRIWENKLYRDVPVLCDGDGPITQLRRWYRQFYVAREQPLAEQRAVTNEESDMTDVARSDDLLVRAKELLPTLASRVADADRLRRIPDETIADFHQAGFFRMLQPSRWGGLEVEPSLFFDVQATIATACASSAWVLGVVAVHNWQLALFPPLAQEEVWGKDRSTLISSSYAPTGKVTRVDGGYRVSGRWSFSSGCDHATWTFLGGLIPPEASGPPEMRTLLVPRSDYQIDDNWHVAGLKGTGSKDIVVENAFVPEHRTHKLMDGFFRKSPGNAANAAPLYRLPFGQIFVRSVSTSAIGIAQGALDAYRSIAAKRVAAGDGAKVAEDPTSQVVAARAASLVDEARLTLHRNMDELMTIARSNGDLPIERRVRFRYDSANAVSKCVEAVDLLFTASGGRAIFLNSPLLRAFLDVHAARAHYANNPDKPARNFGGVLLELKNQDFFL